MLGSHDVVCVPRARIIVEAPSRALHLVTVTGHASRDEVHVSVMGAQDSHLFSKDRPRRSWSDERSMVVVKWHTFVAA
eukprot:14207422-Heterocapsa_arctica.AAC.2